MPGVVFIRDPRNPYWAAQNRDVVQLLGLKPKSKLPKEGMPPRLIDGILVWVTPHVAKTRKDRYTGALVPVKSSTHRVMARCPHCGAEMSAGRLHQHVCNSGPGVLMVMATASARHRGHAMGRWETGGRFWFSQCVRCSMSAQVIEKPRPNEIDVGGEALALGCSKNPFHNS